MREDDPDIMNPDHCECGDIFFVFVYANFQTFFIQWDILLIFLATLLSNKFSCQRKRLGLYCLNELKTNGARKGPDTLCLQKHVASRKA